MKALTEEDLSLFQLFESITGVQPIDYVREGDNYLFIVPLPLVKKAIGREGRNIRALEKALKAEKVYVVGYADSEEAFAKNLFSNARILSTELREAYADKGVFVTVHIRDKAKALGKGKVKLSLAKKAMEKLFNASLFLKAKRM